MFRKFLCSVIPAIVFILCAQPSVFSGTAKTDIFVEKKCSQCHGTGSTSQVGAPPLAKMHESRSLVDFGGQLWNHGPETVKKAETLKISLPHLEGQDIAGLISYITAFQYYQKQQNYKGDPAQGEIVWKGMKCAACHSLGEGKEQRLAPDLRKYEELPAFEMVQSMWNHGPQMVAAMQQHGISTPKFSSKQMLDLLAYIDAQTGKKHEDSLSDLGDPSRGAALFQAKKCVTCHPLEKDHGPKFSIPEQYLEGSAGMAALMWNHSVTMWSEMKKIDQQMPKLENREMADLVAYIYLNSFTEVVGDPVRGKKIFELKHCLTCHRPGASGPAPESLVSAGGLEGSLTVVASLWNHLPSMSTEFGGTGMQFPRMNPGEMNDLVAYLNQSHPAK